MSSEDAARWDAIAAKRLFAVLHFGPDHGTLLIRSPNDGIATPAVNVDLVGKDVRYLALPRQMRGISVEAPNAHEVEAVMAMEFLEGKVSPKAIHILVSGGRRHLVVANYLAKEFNEGNPGVWPFPTFEDFRDPKWKEHKPVQVHRGGDS